MFKGKHRLSEDGVLGIGKHLEDHFDEFNEIKERNKEIRETVEKRNLTINLKRGNSRFHCDKAGVPYFIINDEY